ncbi:hypothetical protein BDF22DRAFT_678789 [Syncephalis plumigaleata]|nr:hypothetical protein BDF22DRAFT_678789 [Syncephalis plumigaleata]
MTSTNEAQSANALGQKLAASYQVVVHAKQHSLEQVNEQLQLLANYGGRLPLTWFTPSLQESLLSLSSESLALKHANMDVPILASTLRLWSFWIRRLGEFHNSPYLEVVLERALTVLNVASNDTRLHPVLEPCIVTLAVAVGKINDEMEKSTTSTLLAWLTEARRKHAELEFIYPCVAHIMRVARRDTTIRDTSAVFLQSWSYAGSESMDEPCMADCQQIYRLYQHILDHTDLSSTDGHANIGTSSRNKDAGLHPLSSVQRRRFEQRIDAILASFEDVSTRSPVVPILDKERRIALENQVWYCIRRVIDSDISLEQSKALAFTCGHCLPVMDLTKRCKGKDKQMIKTLLDTLLAFLLTNPHTLSFGFLDTLSTELTRDATRTPENAITELKKIGHLSRAIACLLTVSPIETIVQSTNSLKTFAQKQLEAWSICSALIPSELDKSVIDMIWQHFKLSLFAMTLIASAIIKQPIEVEQAVDLLFMVQHIHFIALKLGSFSAYQDMLIDIVKTLRKTTDTFSYAVQQIRPTVEEVELNDAKRACLLFYFDLIEQNVDIISDIQLAEEILPLARPYLDSKFCQDAFESAHSVLLSIFLKRKPLAIQLGPYYANWLLDSYPTLLNIDQLRRVYTAMVDCLAEQDSAMAWYTIQRLMNAIDSLSSDESARDDIANGNQLSNNTAEVASTITRGHLLVTLLDQLPTVPLEQTPSLARSALVKILFDNVSQSLDFSRKEQAIKWYLSLANELGQPCVSL